MHGDRCADRSWRVGWPRCVPPRSSCGRSWCSILWHDSCVVELRRISMSTVTCWPNDRAPGLLTPQSLALFLLAGLAGCTAMPRSAPSPDATPSQPDAAPVSLPDAAPVSLPDAAPVSLPDAAPGFLEECGAIALLPPTVTVVNADTGSAICDPTFTVVAGARSTTIDGTDCGQPGTYGCADLPIDGGARPCRYALESLGDGTSDVEVSKAGFVSKTVSVTNGRRGGAGVDSCYRPASQITVILQPIVDAHASDDAN